MALSTRGRKGRKVKNRRRKRKVGRGCSQENRGSVGEVAGGGIRGRLGEGEGNEEEDLEEQEKVIRGSVGEVAGGGIRGRLREGGGNEEEDVEEQEKVKEE